MDDGSTKVNEYLAALDHPLKAGIVELRFAILESNPAISEHIKWNAPSFRFGGEDRVTFRLQPGNRLQLIFHRGSKVRADTPQFVFEDNSGLLTWLARDRAVIDFPDLESVRIHRDELASLVNRWISA